MSRGIQYANKYIPVNSDDEILNVAFDDVERIVLIFRLREEIKERFYQSMRIRLLTCPPTADNLSTTFELAKWQ